MATTPTEIKLLQKPRLLELSFANGDNYTLPCAYLREHSPSADKHGRKATTSFTSDVNIIGIEPVGHYAIKLIFDDGHDTGIYTWEYLLELHNKLSNMDSTPNE